MARSATSSKQLRLLADDDLMRLVADGEVGAFEVLFERHAGAAFSLAYRICLQRPMAEDIAQEALLWLWRSGERYDRTRGSVRAWLLTVVHNRTIDALRRARLNDGRELTEEIMDRLTTTELIETEVVRRAEADDVRLALADLPAEQRQVIGLAYFGGFTHREIAEALELPAGTVKGRMRLALQKLRSSFEPEPTAVA